MNNWTKKLIETELTDSDLLKDWRFLDDDNQFEMVMTQLTRFFSSELITDRDKEYFIHSKGSLENALGLPYTSSSAYAGIWNTNAEVLFNENSSLSLQGFALAKDFRIIALFTDNDENEKFFEVPQFWQYHEKGFRA